MHAPSFVSPARCAPPTQTILPPCGRHGVGYMMPAREREQRQSLCERERGARGPDGVRQNCSPEDVCARKAVRVPREPSTTVVRVCSVHVTVRKLSADSSNARKASAPSFGASLVAPIKFRLQLLSLPATTSKKAACSAASLSVCLCSLTSAAVDAEAASAAAVLCSTTCHRRSPRLICSHLHQ